MSKEIYEIDSVCKYLNVLDEIKSKKHFTDKYLYEIMYRGQQSDGFELKPLIAREDKYFKHEKEMIQKVISYQSDEFSGLNYFDTLVKMQHYGLPTRLMDFTKNPLIALFFASEYSEKTQDENGEILFYKCDRHPFFTSENISIDIVASFSQINVNLIEIRFSDLLHDYCHNNNILAQKCNTLKTYFTGDLKYAEGNFIDEVKACLKIPHYVLTSLTNERIKRQSGAFLLFPNEISNFNEDSVKPLSNDFYILNNIKDFKSRISEQMGCKIVIQKNSKESIIKKLDEIGINRMFLFPDLYETCAYVKAQMQDFIGI